MFKIDWMGALIGFHYQTVDAAVVAARQYFRLMRYHGSFSVTVCDSGAIIKINDVEVGYILHED